MGRPKKAIPDLYWLEQKQAWCINLSGKRHILGKDKGEADRLRLKLLTASQAPKPPGAGAPTQQEIAERDPERLTVGVAMLAYHRGLRQNMDRRHVKRIEFAISLLMGDFADTPASKLSPIHVNEIRQKMIRAGYSRNYINSVTRVIKTAYSWLIANVLVVGPFPHAVVAMRALKENEGGVELAPRLPVDPERVEKTIPHLPPMLRDIVRFILLTGCRPAEVLGMRRCDISTKAGEDIYPLPGWPVSAIASEGKPVVWLFTPKSHKTKHRGKVRIVALGPKVQGVLQPWLDGIGPEEVVFSPRRAEEVRHAEMRRNRKTPVQPSQEHRRKENPKKKPGERYSTDTLDRAIRKACDAAGVDSWVPYQLRHKLATQVAEVHGDEVAAELMGHAPGSGAIRHYTRQKLARLVELAAVTG